MRKNEKKNKKRFGYVENYSYIYKVIKVKQLKHKTKMRKLSNEAIGIIQFMQSTQILTLQHNAKHLSKQKIEQIGNDTAMGAIGLYNDNGIEFLRKLKEQYITHQTTECKKIGWKLITPEYKYEEFSDCTITTLTF